MFGRLLHWPSLAALIRLTLYWPALCCEISCRIQYAPQITNTIINLIIGQFEPDPLDNRLPRNQALNLTLCHLVSSVNEPPNRSMYINVRTLLQIAIIVKCSGFDVMI